MLASRTARNVSLSNFYLPVAVTSPLFGPNLFLWFFFALGVVNAGSCIGPQNKVGHLARHQKQMVQVLVLGTHGLYQTGFTTFTTPLSE